MRLPDCSSYPKGKGHRTFRIWSALIKTDLYWQLNDALRVSYQLINQRNTLSMISEICNKLNTYKEGISYINHPVMTLLIRKKS